MEVGERVCVYWPLHRGTDGANSGMAAVKTLDTIHKQPGCICSVNGPAILQRESKLQAPRPVTLRKAEGQQRSWPLQAQNNGIHARQRDIGGLNASNHSPNSNPW